DLARFHPTQVLETGYEILTLWVSRMIMMSLFAIGEIPFENVYLNGMVLDKNGKKMSKSKGNGIDPLDMIEKFGTDAVRLALLIGNTPGNDMRLSEEKIEGCRNFINKLWNIARFVIETKFPKNYSESKSFLNNFFGNLVSSNLTDADRWILGKLNNLIKEVDNDLKNYKFSQAGEKLREFTWNDFADWYLEVSKFECETRIDTNKKRITTNNNTAKQKILFYILENLLKLWHPFIPFVTEVIWNQLSIKNQEINKLNHKNLLMIQKWPDIRCSKTEVELLSTEVERISTSVFRHRMSNNFEIIKNIIIVIRNARAENKVEPGKKIKAIICSKKYYDLIKNNKILIQKMRTGIEELEIKETGEKINNAIKATAGEVEIYLINAVDKEKEDARVKKEVENLKKLINNIEQKLSNQEFIQKAPKEIVEKEKKRLEGFKAELSKME
ncbi:MAG: class I tRNA ligase family protein, partial [Patescibacteria group bacterium]